MSQPPVDLDLPGLLHDVGLAAVGLEPPRQRGACGADADRVDEPLAPEVGAAEGHGRSSRERSRSAIGAGAEQAHRAARCRRGTSSSTRSTPRSPAAPRRVEVGAAGHGRGRAGGDRLDDVAAAADAAVADDLGPAADGVGDRRDERERRRARRRAGGRRGSTARSASTPALGGEHRVVDGLDALERRSGRPTPSAASRRRPTTAPGRTGC